MTFKNKKTMQLITTYLNLDVEKLKKKKTMVGFWSSSNLKNIVILKKEKKKNEIVMDCCFMVSTTHNTYRMVNDNLILGSTYNQQFSSSSVKLESVFKFSMGFQSHFFFFFFNKNFCCTWFICFCLLYHTNLPVCWKMGDSQSFHRANHRRMLTV